MAEEIERKFLVDRETFMISVAGITRQHFMQAYIPTQDNTTVLLRVVGDVGYLTIKGENRGIVRSEFEYSIPLNDAKEMIDTLCQRPAVEKYRYEVTHEGTLWEVDLFQGENEGLLVAEVELESETQTFTRPEWLAQEVSGVKRYYNSQLAVRPFSEWSLDEKTACKS